jgi:hypothetical protein
MGGAGRQAVEVEMEQSWERMWHNDWWLLAMGHRWENEDIPLYATAF